MIVQLKITCARKLTFLSFCEDTAGGFLDFVQGANEEEEENDEDQTPKPYESPTTVPDSDLTAGEVVLVVLEAILNNDTPSDNRGVELLFGYASAGSQIRNEEGLTPKEYAEFLKETEYKVLFDHQETVRAFLCFIIRWLRMDGCW